MSMIKNVKAKILNPANHLLVKIQVDMSRKQYLDAVADGNIDPCDDHLEITKDPTVSHVRIEFLPANFEIKTKNNNSIMVLTIDGYEKIFDTNEIVEVIIAKS